MKFKIGDIIIYNRDSPSKKHELKVISINMENEYITTECTDCEAAPEDSFSFIKVDKYFKLVTDYNFNKDLETILKEGA